MQYYPQVVRLGIRDHDKLQRSGRLVIMKFIMSGSVGYKAGCTSISLSSHILVGREFTRRLVLPVF